MNTKNRVFTKLQNHNLKQKFVSDYQSGFYTIEQLAKTYNVDRRKLLKWKKQIFGLGSIRQRRIYELHTSGMPTKAIADIYKTHIVVVQKSIREYKNRLTTQNSHHKPVKHQ